MKVRVDRCVSFTAEASGLLQEYYDAIGVVLRDGPGVMERMIADERSGMWVAYVGAEAAGCVVLRAGVPEAGAGECKRLYVRPAFRRRGVAEALMEALEGFARGVGIGWVYLDTNEAFRASVALYRGRGYEACERYNANPQATMFFERVCEGLVIWRGRMESPRLAKRRSLHCAGR